MNMSDIYLDQSLAKAQALLWGGSETENIEAHNIIAKLIADRAQMQNWTQSTLFDIIEVNPTTERTL
jgi:hypothetical protein